jgi:thiol:disulfide interchange protein DsbD
MWHLIPVHRTAKTVFVCLFLATLTAKAAHTQVQLLLSANPARPGETILAGMDLKMDLGWHTYWQNPGEAGEATEIKWQLPPGITAGEILWPLPEKLPPAEVTTYGYEKEVMLVVPLTLASNLPAGPLALKADVSWLECDEQCVPGKTSVEATLNLAPEGKPSADAARIQDWASRVPTAATNFFLQAWWETGPADDTRSLLLQCAGPAKPDGVDFYPDAYDNLGIQAGTKWGFDGAANKIWLQKSVKKFSGTWPDQIAGVLVVQHGTSRVGYQIAAAVAKTAPLGGNGAGSANPPPLPAQPLWRMLVFAFIGGLILNIMPCVLPVIALKILGFVNEAKSEPRHVRKLGLIYTLGVLASFSVLGGAVVAVKLAGHQAAWGMQFGNPIFLVSLITLVTLVALNLFGVFEVTLASGAMNVASDLSSKSGASGAFFNGALATALATPCSAPILGSALAFAFTQPATTLMLVFLTIGLGLAAPYLVLSWHPAWLKFLPKPGLWMEKFKMAMGFPMLAAVLWLYNIASATYGKSVLWLGVFLVLLAAAAWTFGSFVQRGSRRKGIATVVVLLLLATGYGYALEKELNWRHPVIEPPATGVIKESADGIAWLPWSPEAVAQARAAGKVVLVDFTADWCLTCQVNKKTSIEIPSVREKLKSLNAVALLADYTHTPDNITTELTRYHRAGVPLVLVYPRNAGSPAIELPEVLTPNIVLNALDQAAE